MGARIGDAVAVKLIEIDGAVGLGFDDEKRGKPYFVDFLSPSWRLKLHKGIPRSHILRRALGATKGTPLVCDATAGFGGDSVLALSAGCEVVAIERSPLVYQVLADGLRRAGEESPDLKKLFSKFRLLQGDALKVLNGLQPRPQVVYLDPMFEKPKKNAKSPKAMQLLQELLGESSLDEELALLDAAWAATLSRVVVKRPLKAPALKPSPAHTFKGQSVRYDVYLK